MSAKKTTHKTEKSTPKPEQQSASSRPAAEARDVKTGAPVGRINDPDPNLIKAAGPAPAEPMPEQSDMTIEQLLADPRFDPEGRVRDRLAEISANGPLGQRPPADLVDADGMPIDRK